ncbi:hypothetical protein FPOAC2_11978 [Fusarium poae]|uniref:Mtf2-like C-terminal domain-containing protein n=1 Tax=Fusarium poae TaxID=36050 RepID=A0A1B8AF33_FUSPO|nr:hypothetical protein FPOAC1_011666 [Fusarium poae]KAG8666845.1 hypothetical protein FPOAC1_011666 [Fusarium poae]OBS19091.1 hypothetical protein FPOA_10815 [Fusarium poae]
MSRNLLPFLYQTRTLQLACRRPASILFTQKAGVATNSNQPRKIDNSIPFEFDDEDTEDIQGLDPDANAHIEPGSTLTPGESEIFKRIFDDISNARLPQNKKSSRPQAAQPAESSTPSDLAKQRMGDTLVEKARGANASDDFLKRYPLSLRKAAQNALGKFESAPKRPKLYNLAELDKAEKAQMRKWANYEDLREKERERVMNLMKKCNSDVELWDVMEKEVFSLPKELGIVEEPKTAKRGRKPKNAPATEEKKVTTKEEKPIMDVHGYLYSDFLTYGLNQLDTAFPKPSLLAFNILPRIKELGLSSYVLGVSSPLFIRLAQIHWERYGDAESACDALDEMKPLGIFPTEIEKIKEVEKVVKEIEEHLHSCTWGAQGPFVMAMMQGGPYDATLTARLGRLKGIIASKYFYNERVAMNLEQDVEVKTQHLQAAR